MKFLVIFISFAVAIFHHVAGFNNNMKPRVTNQGYLIMKVENDAFRKANRAMRQAGADERTVELKMPLGLELDEDPQGNVFIKSIEKGGRAEKTGKVFVGDIVAMASATFG